MNKPAKGFGRELTSGIESVTDLDSFGEAFSFSPDAISSFCKGTFFTGICSSVRGETLFWPEFSVFCTRNDFKDEVLFVCIATDDRLTFADVFSVSFGFTASSSFTEAAVLISLTLGEASVASSLKRENLELMYVSESVSLKA